ncbi:hypothetical protein GCM10009078_29890 [Cupriavidus gilardii]
MHLGAETVLLLWRQRLQAIAHRIDKELLADREAHRQRIEERRAERIARAPMPRDRRFHIDEQAANDEMRHGGLPGGVAGTSPGWYCGVPIMMARIGTVKYHGGG